MRRSPKIVRVGSRDRAKRRRTFHRAKSDAKKFASRIIFECDGILEVPIQPITPVNSKPGCEEHRRPKPLPSLHDDTETPWSRKVSQARHDQAVGDVPVRGFIVERAKNQQRDAERWSRVLGIAFPSINAEIPFFGA